MLTATTPFLTVQLFSYWESRTVIVEAGKFMRLIDCNSIGPRALHSNSEHCNCIYSLFAKLPWPGDSEETLRF